MKASELRIGNWVFEQSDKLIKDFSKPVQISVVTKQTEHKYRPIPLTEEWLLKLGFEYAGMIGNELIVFKKGNIALLSRDSKIFFPSGYEEIQIAFVHTLQNFFTLTGKELTYNQ